MSVPALSSSAAKTPLDDGLQRNDRGDHGREVEAAFADQPDQLGVGVAVADAGHDGLFVVDQGEGVEGEPWGQTDQDGPAPAPGGREAGVQRGLRAD
ncbi:MULTISPECIES: hypothetical protein, partial [Streptomyces]|uniref:hypothetical protein n=1 Tax=Streptomyces sp. SID5471 TaxID=2690298 RepID=UPI0002AC6598